MATHSRQHKYSTPTFELCTPTCVINIWSWDPRTPGDKKNFFWLVGWSSSIHEKHAFIHGMNMAQINFCFPFNSNPPSTVPHTGLVCGGGTVLATLPLDALSLFFSHLGGGDRIRNLNIYCKTPADQNQVSFR